MKSVAVKISWFLGVFLGVLAAHAQENGGLDCSQAKIRSAQNARLAARAAYPGDTLIDVTYVKLDLTIRQQDRYILGAAKTIFKAKGTIKEVSLDLTGQLKVYAVISKGRKLAYSQGSNKVKITLPTVLNTGGEETIDVFYEGTPPTTAFGSFSFGTHGTAKAPAVWSLSEPYGAPDWWPCKDDPADKIDSTQVSITMDKSFVSVSNGILSDMIDNGAANTRTYVWKNSHPISHYLVSVACSNYVLYDFNWQYGGKTMPVLNYIYPESLTQNLKTLLDRTGDMLTFFSDTFGEYPFINEKYGHAMCGFGGGMEHQTVSSMGGFSESLIAHELAHQWFGDKITCKTWADIFMNEAFASYSEALWAEKRTGKSAYMSNINGHITRAKTVTEPVYISNPKDENLVFDYNLTYGKGAVVLHMLRGVLGDAAFFDVLKGFMASEHAYKAATINDFRVFAEKQSGKELKYFFDEWVYGTGFPVYKINWLSAGANKLKIEASQTGSKLFRMPMEVKVVYKDGKEEVRIIVIDKATNVFEINDLTGGELSEVTFDPNGWIMKTMTVGKLELLGNEPKADESWIYPNPVNDILTVKVPENGLYELEIRDIRGGKVDLREATKGKVDVSRIQAGKYFLRVLTAERAVNGVFVKE
ncbi:MAG: T9SS type A sorting domain-containing protein [Cytophagaceae bacterium]|nr:T9SS type A sorting domain-containing protein [Cytophagaceae bacterium]MBL0325693.1 T9SS type A sorting domain-containing protein [Cytophagaceae bacterium]